MPRYRRLDFIGQKRGLWEEGLSVDVLFTVSWMVLGDVLGTTLVFLSGKLFRVGFSQLA